MEQIFYTWIALGVLCLIIETFTSSTYSFGVGVGAFLTAIFVQVFSQHTFTLAQGGIFVLVTIAAFFVFPRLFPTYFAQGKMIALLGRHAHLKQIDGQWKIELDGAYYSLDSKSEAVKKEGLKVRIVSYDDGIFDVENLD